MAAPVSSNYSVAEGQPIYAGKHRSGFPRGAQLGAVVAGGGFNNNASLFAGGAVLGGVSASGTMQGAGNVYVGIWGQSNAVGRAKRADIYTSPLSSDAGLATFDGGTFSRVWIWTGSAFSQLQGSNNGSLVGDFGPEFGLAVRWMRETSSGNLYLQKEAESGVSISYFAPAAGTGIAAFSRTAAAVAWLVANGHQLSAKGWLWVQGEADAGATQGTYQTALQEIVDAMLAGTQMDAGSISVLTQMRVGSGAYGAGVAAAKDAIAAASPSIVKTISMVYDDGFHANGRGQVQLGYDAFEKLFGASHIAT